MEVGSAVELRDRSRVGELRREAVALAVRLGLDEESAGRVAIVATELATNVIKHGGGGWGFVAPAESREPECVQILVVDSGPGLSDPARAFADGFSTTGTRGEGLGAVRRLSCRFDLYTREGSGLAAFALVGRDPTRPPPHRPPGLELAGLVVPHRGEAVSGDAWSVLREEGTIHLLVSDGLGHGVDAAAASDAAVRAFRAAKGAGAQERVERIHEALRPTRGAAVAVATLEPARGSVRFAGIGNISGQIVTSDDARSLVSMNGTAGGRARSVKEFEYALPSDALLVLHSDGLTSRWSMDPYSGLRSRDPALVAGILFRDFRRGPDDATVVVLRSPTGAQPGAPTERRP